MVMVNNDSSNAIRRAALVISFISVIIDRLHLILKKFCHHRVNLNLDFFWPEPELKAVSGTEGILWHMISCFSEDLNMGHLSVIGSGSRVIRLQLLIFVVNDPGKSFLR